MDPFTQGALGAALPQSIASSKQLKSAALVGAISGMAPDLDILIQSSKDPLLFLEYHRQFSHALLFIPIGALICALLLFPIIKNLSFKQTYFFCFLGHATHGLLDACTSYGTQLFWPVSDMRFAWHSISIVDPLLTLPMVALIITAVIRRNPIYARFALIWVIAYFTLSMVQQDRVERAGAELAATRGQKPVELEAKPSFGNLLVWKVIYEAGDRYYVDAVRAGIDITLLPGQSAEKLNINRHFPNVRPGTRQADDIERFRKFSSGYLARDPHHPARIIDVRYSMMPNEIDALWSIEIENLASPDDHVTFVTNRSDSRNKLAKLMAMIFGK